jgi:hypothetical protein
VTLEVRFLGVFLLVRPADEDTQLARILIPNAIDPTHHEDGDPAVKHYPFLVRDDDAAACSVPAKPRTLLDLHRTEVSFRFDRDQEPGATSPTKPSSLDWTKYDENPLIRMRPRVSEDIRLRKDLSPFTTPDPRLGARIVLDRGAFSTCKPSGTTAKFMIRGKLLGKPNDEDDLTEAISLTCLVLNVPAVFVDFRTAADAPWETIELKEIGARPIRLTIGNLCADNPRKWPLCADSPCTDGEAVDHDFKWMYRLFEHVDGNWPPDRRKYFPVPVGVCGPSPRGATTSTCWGGECGPFC